MFCVRPQAIGSVRAAVCTQLRSRPRGGRTPISPTRLLSHRFVPGRGLVDPAMGGGRRSSLQRARWLGRLPRGPRGGWGRWAIHLLLLQRNGAAQAPAHLSSASFADNGHLSSLSSAPMSSALLTARGGAHGLLNALRTLVHTEPEGTLPWALGSRPGSSCAVLRTAPCAGRPAAGAPAPCRGDKVA